MQEVKNSVQQELSKGFEGRILFEGENGFDDARRIWNAMIDRKPSVIVQPKNSKDVINAVNFARQHNLPVSVKGGGHNVAGNAVCDNGMMIDLNFMKSINLDAEMKIAKVEGGCLLGEVDAETQKYGLAVSSGIISHTGVAGLTLGGGFGWISRKFGFSVDNLITAEVITADGQHLKASENENEDLFWGIRGGGGNFGIVTSFEFKCAEIGKEIFSGLIVYPFDIAKKYIQFHREYVRTLPDEMTIWMVIRHAPPLPFLPDEIHGKMIVAVPFVYIGDKEKGEKLIKPVLEFDNPLGSAVGMNPWTAWQSGFDALESHGARNYWKSHNLKDLSDGFIDKVFEFGSKLPGPDCGILIPHMEGKPGRVSIDQTAYAFRKAPFLINIHTRWTNPADDERCIKWGREFFESTKPFAEGVYVNFLSEEGEERVREAYPDKTWNRLVELKRKYDPENFFRMNQNIKPA